MKFTLRFTISDTTENVDDDYIVYSKQNIPLSTMTSINCVWQLPFKMDGLDLKDTLKIAFCIETDHKIPHYYTIFEHCIQIKKLSFQKQTPLSKLKLKSSSQNGFKRQSITFSKYTLPVLEQNCLHVEDVKINYIAEKCNDLIRLHISSILVPTPSQQICVALARTGITMILNEYGKANSITTSMENDTRVYTWRFDPNSTVRKTVYNYSLDTYDVESTGDSLLLGLQQDVFQLVFTRYVYFPFFSSGLKSKSLDISIKKVDYEAVISRCNSLNSAGTKTRSLNKSDNDESTIYVLERGIRQGILLKISFDSLLQVHGIELHVDNYKDNIEKYFKE